MVILQPTLICVYSLLENTRGYFTWPPAIWRNYASLVVPPRHCLKALCCHHWRDLWATVRQYTPSEVGQGRGRGDFGLPRTMLFSVNSHRSEFSTLCKFIFEKAKRNHAGLCVGGCHGYTQSRMRSVWAGCRAAEFCLPLISAVEEWMGVVEMRGGGGGGWVSPCRALMQVWCAGMGIRCCTPIMTNIFRRHRVRAQVAFFFCIQIPLT